MTQRITKLILMPCHIPAKRHMHSSPPNIECAYTNITNHVETNSNTKISKINTKTTKQKTSYLGAVLGLRTRVPQLRVPFPLPFPLPFRGFILGRRTRVPQMGALSISLPKPWPAVLGCRTRSPTRGSLSIAHSSSDYFLFSNRFF